MEERSAEACYSVAPSVQTWSFDVSGKNPSYLVEVGSTQRFEVTAGVYRVIELLRQQPRSVDDIVAALRMEGSGTASVEKISWLVRSILLPRRIAEVEGDGTVAETLQYRPAKKRSNFLWLQVPLVGPEALRPLTHMLGVLFNPWIAVPLLGATVGASMFFYGGVMPGFRWDLGNLSPAQGLLLLVALNLTAMFHEIGHASACRYFGSSHGKIGWGVYLFMLVLYTDVSPVWRLKRWQRAVVDAGGMYFEAIATLLFLSLYWITGHPLFVYGFVFVNLSMANSLNPILRQDGYWLLSDLSGQTNLRQATLELIRYVAERAVGKKGEWRPALFSKPRWLQATIVIYTILSVAFSTVLVAWLVNHLVADVIPLSWGLISRILMLLQSGSPSVGEILSLAGRLGLQFIFVLLVGAAAWSLGFSILQPLVKRGAYDTQGSGRRAEWREPS